MTDPTPENSNDGAEPIAKSTELAFVRLRVSVSLWLTTNIAYRLQGS
jgi:hypothetical protein